LSLFLRKEKIYLLVDEYDNFIHTILSTTGQERYTAISHGEGFYSHFFNVIKAGTTGVGAPVSKVFITGVSPVSMDNIGGGFNIGDNIITNPNFGEIVGFTEKEVVDLLHYYHEREVLRETPDKIIEIMRTRYNNYLFSAGPGG